MHMYGFLLLFNGDSAPLRDIGLQNLSNLNIDLSMWLRSNVMAHQWTPHIFCPINVY